MTKENTQLAVFKDKVNELRKATGAKSNAFWPTKIRVNRTPLDSANNTLPMGKYVLKVDNQEVFLDTVPVMVVQMGTQYVNFLEPNNPQFTMIETNFKGEYKDTKGGVRLGKPVGKDVQLTREQKEVKFTLHVLGIADVKGATDRTGKVIFTETTYVPVSLSYRGKRSVEKQNEIRKLKKREEGFVDFFVVLEKPVRGDDVGGSIFYEYNISRGNNVDLTEDMVDGIQAVLHMLEEENKRLYARHLTAARGQDSVDDDAVEGTYTDLDLDA